MPLPLPNLDDLAYADLMEEARALIPGLDPKWTDHNPADPGITLIELFAYLTEMLIYRTNRVPDQNLITFLKLLNDPQEWQPGTDLAEDMRTSVVALRRRYRAVTCGDYEALAMEASRDVARARCVPRRYLGAGTDTERTAPRPGHVSVIVVPDSVDPAPQPSEELRHSVWNYLDPRRVLTTRHHVVGPVYAPVSAELLIARRADMPEADLRGQVVQALDGFFHPREGGPDGDGWPFGRDIYLSEIYKLLEGVPGVDYVSDVMLASHCPEGAARCVAASELWHKDGEPIGLGLEAHHLPWAQIDPDHVVISAAFVPVQVTIRATPAESIAPAAFRRAVKTVVKHRFHPLHNGPETWRTESWEVTKDDIRAQVRDREEINNEQGVDVELQGDPDLTSVGFEAQELADVQVIPVLR